MTDASELQQAIGMTEFQLQEAQKALMHARADVDFYQQKLAKTQALLQQLRSSQVTSESSSDPRTLLKG